MAPVMRATSGTESSATTAVPDANKMALPTVTRTPAGPPSTVTMPAATSSASSSVIAKVRGSSSTGRFGAIPFHFTTKEALWKAAAESLMGKISEQLMTRAQGLEGVDVRTRVRLLVTEFVRFNATHPHFHRFMLQEGKTSSERLVWLVDHYIRGFMEVSMSGFRELEADGVELPAPPEELMYMLIGAATTRYTLAPEFEMITSKDVFAKEAIDAHAEAVVRLFFPQLAADAPATETRP